IADTLVRSSAISLLIVDSVAALTPKAELDGDMGDSHMGLQARLMSQALRKLTGSISKSNTTVIFINQLRMKIGVMFGNPETTTGGNALKFYSSVRIDIRRIGAIKNGDEVVGNRTRVKVVKNKVAPPFKTIEFDIMYGEGISKTGDLLDLAVQNKIVDKAGAWYSYKGEKIGQGRENSKIYLSENTSIMEEIKKLLLIQFGIEKDSEKITPLVNEKTGEIMEATNKTKTKKSSKVSKTLQ
ncbi:MAG: recombinase RecA, partial [Bdellovibrionales bacterium]|nr:recombinase RecA [Bdellovibrionales bacterium]